MKIVWIIYIVKLLSHYEHICINTFNKNYNLHLLQLWLAANQVNVFYFVQCLGSTINAKSTQPGLEHSANAYFLTYEFKMIKLRLSLVSTITNMLD